MIWESNISPGCVCMYAFLVAGVTMVLAGWVFDEAPLGQLGVISAGFGIGLMILRDNQRTRRMLGRPGEHVGPMRSVPRDWI